MWNSNRTSQECSAFDSSPWNVHFRFLILGASGAIFFAQLTRIMVKYSQGASFNTFAAYITAILIMAISFLSELVTVYGCIGYSVDIFGIISPAVQWAEWQITVPAM